MSFCYPTRPFLPIGVAVFTAAEFCWLYHALLCKIQGSEGEAQCNRREALKTIYFVDRIPENFLDTLSESFRHPLCYAIIAIAVTFIFVQASICQTNAGIVAFVWIVGFRLFQVLVSAWKSNEHVSSTLIFVQSLSLAMVLMAVLMIQNYVPFIVLTLLFVFGMAIEPFWRVRVAAKGCKACTPPYSSSVECDYIRWQVSMIMYWLTAMEQGILVTFLAECILATPE